jgi:hypothetical protein
VLSCVLNQPKDQIEIYSLHGLLLLKTNAVNSTTNIPLPVKGIFIVKIRDFTEKIIF